MKYEVVSVGGGIQKGNIKRKNVTASYLFSAAKSISRDLYDSMRFLHFHCGLLQEAANERRLGRKKMP